jgi:signal transduction histidine kinase
MITRHVASAERIEMLRLPAHQACTLYGAEEPYRDLVEQMQEGAVVLTGDGDILYANARFAALVGEPRQAVSGSRFDRYVHAADKEDVERLMSTGSGRRRCRLLGPGWNPFEAGLSLITTRSPRGDRRSLIVTDMTELLEAHRNHDRAERDSRTKDEFLAMLAHELRTPLGAISAALHVIRATHAKEGPVASARDVIGRQVAHITRLIDDLLDIEGVVSGKMRLDPQPFDLAVVVCQAIATFTAGVTLDRHIDVRTEPTWVEGDAVRMEQVLSNILTNAVKYTAPGGRIQVAVRAEGADAVLRVEDTGFGIPPALLPFVFDLYVQADETLQLARGGLGIGLALVRRLVELHGGTVTASSDGEGCGSAFTVRLKRISSGSGRVAGSLTESRPSSE